MWLLIHKTMPHMKFVFLRTDSCRYASRRSRFFFIRALDFWSPGTLLRLTNGLCQLAHNGLAPSGYSVYITNNTIHTCHAGYTQKLPVDRKSLFQFFQQCSAQSYFKIYSSVVRGFQRLKFTLSGLGFSHLATSRQFLCKHGKTTKRTLSGS